jgi:hypothetical protein
MLYQPQLGNVFVGIKSECTSAGRCDESDPFIFSQRLRVHFQDISRNADDV